MFQKRQDNYDYLLKEFSSLLEFFILPEATTKSEPSWFGFPLIVRPEAGINRNDLQRFLDQKKIRTRLSFAGNITKQPYFENVNYRICGNLTNTDVVLNNTLWLGVFPGLDIVHLDYIVECFKEFTGEAQW